MPRRIGPEAKIIALFTALPDESKRIVFDVIRSQTAAPRKPATKKKKDTPAVTPTLLPESEEKEPICGACGNVAGYTDHFQPSPNYHEFDAPKTAKKVRAASAEK